MFNTKDALDITMYPNPKNELKENSSYLEKGFFFGGCNLFWTIMSLVPGTRPVWRKKARSGSWLSKVSVVWTRLVIYRLLGAEMTPLCAMETSACITRECLSSPILWIKNLYFRNNIFLQASQLCWCNKTYHMWTSIFRCL